jgi:arginine-tRNA-protein transferase
MNPSELPDYQSQVPPGLVLRGTPVIVEAFTARNLPDGWMDVLWRQAWRHFGERFIRYSVSEENLRLQVVQPLRVVLQRFTPSRGQRRILRRNRDLEVRIGPPELNADRHHLFEIHKRRFITNVPDALADFLGDDPGRVPCETVEVTAFFAGRLIAASYLDVGREGASSVYGMFDPAHARRGLGIATMLWEMEYARERGCRFYYPGYAFHEPSLLDYKKQFSGMEWFDWLGDWHPLKRSPKPAPESGGE